MASLGKTTWRGEAGQVHRFKVYALGTKLRKVCGLYVITRRRRKADGGYGHVPLYVGQTEDLSQPFGQHRKAAEFRQRGANCICLHSDDSEDSRLAKEQALIATLHPACND
jgi:hypothetical protein